MITWWLNCCRASIDNRVWDFLNLDTSFGKMVEEISAATHIRKKKVLASLRRLSAQQRVDSDGQGRWRKVNF